MAKGVLRSSKTKDVYKKFVNILDTRPHIWDPAPAPKLKVNPPMPPKQVDPPRMPAMGNPTSNSGASSDSNWVLGKIPTDEEDPRNCFLTGILFSSNLQCLLPRCLIPSHPFLTSDGRPQWVRGRSCSSCQWIALKGILLWTKCPNRRLLPRR